MVKSTCQGALDECSGGTIPDVGSLAQTLMTATQNPEWNTAQVKKKILHIHHLQVKYHHHQLHLQVKLIQITCLKLMYSK